MKDYQKVIEILLSAGTPNAIANKWAKLASTTIDDDLRMLAIDLSRLYKAYLQRGATFVRDHEPIIAGNKIVTQTDWMEVRRVLEARVKKLVDSRLAQGKPAWMIMAEKHGWGPLNR